MWPGAHSVLEPAATASVAIHALWSVMFWTSTAIFVVVLAVLVLALARRRANESTETPDPSATPAALTRMVAAATGLTVIVLFGFLLTSLWTSRAMAAVRPGRAITIEVTGHQWWW